MSLVLKIEVADWNASPKRGSSGVAATKRRETRSAAHTAHSSVSICWGFALELSNCAHVVLPQVSWPFHQLPGVVVGCPCKNACVSELIGFHDVILLARWLASGRLYVRSVAILSRLGALHSFLPI